MRIPAIILPMTIVWTAVGFGASAFAGNEGNRADLENGSRVYEETCVFCHGSGGKGEIPGVPNLTKKSGPLSKTDSELSHNIAAGFQSPGSAMAMPAKGGNPDLTDSDVRDVLAYLREKFSKN